MTHTPLKSTHQFQRVPMERSCRCDVSQHFRGRVLPMLQRVCEESVLANAPHSTTPLLPTTQLQLIAARCISQATWGLLGDVYNRYCRVRSSRTPRSRPPPRDPPQPQTRPEQGAGLQERHHRPQEELRARPSTPSTQASRVGRRYVPSTPALGIRGSADASPSLILAARPATPASKSVRDSRGAAAPTSTPSRRPEAGSRARPASAASSIVRDSSPPTGYDRTSVVTKPWAAKRTDAGTREAHRVRWAESLPGPSATTATSSPRKELGQATARDPGRTLDGGAATSMVAHPRRVGERASMGRLRSSRRHHEAAAKEALEGDGTRQTPPTTQNRHPAQRPELQACDAATPAATEKVEQQDTICSGVPSPEARRDDVPLLDPTISRRAGSASSSERSTQHLSGPRIADAGVQASPSRAGEIAATETTRWLQWNPVGKIDDIWGQHQQQPLHGKAFSEPPDSGGKCCSSPPRGCYEAKGGSAARSSSSCCSSTGDREISPPFCSAAGGPTSAGDGNGGCMIPRGDEMGAAGLLDVSRQAQPPRTAGSAFSLPLDGLRSSADAAMNACAPLALISDPFARSATADLLPVARV